MDFEIFKIILVSKKIFNLFLIINLKFILKFILIFLFAFSSHFGREKQRRQNVENVFSCWKCSSNAKKISKCNSLKRRAREVCMHTLS